MQFVDLKTQYKKVEKDVTARIMAVLEHGQYILGPEVEELEKKLAAFTGSQHCVAVASGTDALLIALIAAGVQAGDEVITTPFSFFATVETIVLMGAKPVFVDIDPRSYNLDPNQIEVAITHKTKAIIPVSLYGQCADFDAINAIAATHGIAVIEDAAQSFGATYEGRASCNLSTIGCTSFFPSKPLGCYGDGGACFTNDASLATAMRELRAHGQSKRYTHTRIGINGRMDTLQAAILLAKLDLFREEIPMRKQVAQLYSEKLSGLVTTPYVEPYNQSVFAQYTIEVEQRERMQAALQERGIPTAVHYPTPLHQQPAVKGLVDPALRFPIAENAAKRVMSLPMHPYLLQEEQDSVVRAIREIILSSAV